MTAKPRAGAATHTGPRPTRVRVEHARDGVRVEELASGDFLTPRLLDRHGHHVRIALVGHQAMLLAGDRLDLRVAVGAGVHLELVEPSGTVAYHARGGRSGWSAGITVDTGGILTWRSAPFVVADGADVTRDLQVTLGEGGVAALRETLVLGRYAEQGGSLLARQRATLGGTPLLVEELDARDPRARARPGVLGPHRVVATAMLLGMRPDTTARSDAVPHADEAVDPHATPLAGPGALARALATTAHEADRLIDGTWSSWSGEAARRAPRPVSPGAPRTPAGAHASDDTYAPDVPTLQPSS